MLSEWVHYQGKAVKLNFQNGISQNSGKYKLGGFLLRQSHICSGSTMEDTGNTIYGTVDQCHQNNRPVSCKA